MKIFGVIIAVIFVVVFFLASIDREVARQDYLNGDKATDCIFKFNCDHFNNMD